MGNSVFHLSLEFLMKFWKKSLKITQKLLNFIADFTVHVSVAVLEKMKI